MPISESRYIGLAQLRLDGFVALEAGQQHGTLTTKPFKLEGKQIVLNIDASGPGRMRIELLDVAGSPVPEFSGEHSSTFHGVDAIRLLPKWKSHSDVSDLTGQIVRLRIHLDNARLYAFQVQP